MKSIRGGLLLVVAASVVVAGCFFAGSTVMAQNAGTGAIAGIVTDPSGKAVLGARITVTNEATMATIAVKSQSGGTYTAPLLLPGTYSVEVSKEGFKVWVATGIRVNVTETSGLNIKLELGAINQKVTVQAQASALQTESSTQGHVTGAETIQNLPLATRNYTQILGLNPNVSANVTNAMALGTGGDLYDNQVIVNGVSTNDNNVQMDGVGINDRLEFGSQFSSGTPIPNPDTIQEFKVQTSQYDASYGRDAGANINVVSKGGSNEFHGNAWEYFRNTALNANEYFNKLTQLEEGESNTPPIFNSNQFGGDLGGPIKKDKLFFFGSYQGTHQANGEASGCAGNISGLGGLTNNRTAAGLVNWASQTDGTLIGINGGTPVAGNGSNISSQALAIMNLKLPNGQYLIPTPPAGASNLFVSVPCPFTENQFMTNADYNQSDKSKFSARFFFANDLSTYTMAGGVPGIPQVIPNHYRNFSLRHDYTFSSLLSNQVTFGFHRTYNGLSGTNPFSFSGIGAAMPSFDNNYPDVQIDDSFTINGAPSQLSQEIVGQTTFDGQDTLSYITGRHFFRFGGGVTRTRSNVDALNTAYVEFGSVSDFLLGACGGLTTTTCPNSSIHGNGSGASNIESSSDYPPGPLQQELVNWDFNGYMQDDIKATSRLTLNLGFRYDRVGYEGDQLGRNTGFDPNLITPYQAPATNCMTENGTGSLLGYTVPSNFVGTPPCQVSRLNNEAGFNNPRPNTWNPRVGFAWRLPHTERVVLRGGYGIYHEILIGSSLFNTIFGLPFLTSRSYAAADPIGMNASWVQPMPPFTATLPSYIPYTTTGTNSEQSVYNFAPNLRVPMVQQYSLNVQTELAKGLVLEVGYVGNRGTHLFDIPSVNQACLVGVPISTVDACPTNLPAGSPLAGVTTNSAANAYLRVPYSGFGPETLRIAQSEGSDWYNALVATLTKRFKHGLQFQLSYTFNKEMETFAGGESLIGGSGGIAHGDQNHPLYGPDGTIRPQRFVASYVYQLPGPKNLNSFAGRLLGGWQWAGVTTYQSGQYLTILNSNNGRNIYGITNPSFVTASLAPGCTVGQLVNPGSVQSKLGPGSVPGTITYFNAACLAHPTIAGALATMLNVTGSATGFGNLGAGIVRGPDQANWDMSLGKHFLIRWPNEGANMELRGDFFNTFNHTQFGNPNVSFGNGKFGDITSSSVNPRIIQLALRFNF